LCAAHAYYVFAPLALAVEGAAYTCNTFSHSNDNDVVFTTIIIEDPVSSSTSSSSSYAIRLASGITLFIVFTWLQHTTHRALSALRSRSGRNGSGRDSSLYVVPQGGAFTVLVAPHYNAEMGIYVALLLLLGTWHSLWTLVTLFVVINLTHAAYKTRVWYSRTFPHFNVLTRNAKRYILLPYIF
jgi:hypothetical protein